MAMNMTIIHCNLSVVDSSGNVTNIRPQVDGEDISINASEYGSGSSAQSLVNSLGRIAFDKNFKGLNDNAGEGDTKVVYSIDKINALVNNARTSINYVKTNYAGWFNENTPSVKPSV